MTDIGPTTSSPVTRPAQRTRRRLWNLSPREYEHPFDRRALDALESNGLLEKVVRVFSQHSVERLLRIQYTGSNLRVTSKSFPELQHVLEEACQVLGVARLPQLYVKWGYGVNAFTAGVESPILVLDSGCIDLLTPDELLFVIGHEIGHIKSEHVLYRQMAQLIPVLGDLVGSVTLGLGRAMSMGFEVALFNWMRMSEFTADRAGLLACQNPEAATTAMVKLAGAPKEYFERIDMSEFIEQARTFENFDYDTLDRVAKFASILWHDHPWTVMRAAEFYRWLDTGAYHRIVDRYGGRHEASSALRTMPPSQEPDDGAARSATDAAASGGWIARQLAKVNQELGTQRLCPSCGARWIPGTLTCAACTGRA